MSMKPPQTTGFPQKIEQRYKFVKELGRGAYGVVCSAWDRVTDRPVAIKKIQRLLEKQIFAKRALREIKLLWHFNGHENITPLLDIEVVDPIMYAEVYIVQELMEADLHQIIRSGQPLTDEHYQYFMYQICRGLKYIHSANVLHRDLKPGNLLVNADCELKICDFGLARGLSDNPTGFLTEYVATRWYRAPEIMLSFKSYTKAVDMWSLGCIFAELLGRKPIFKGRDYVDQLNQILAVLGTPDATTLKSVGSLRAQLYIKSLPESKGCTWESLYPNATKPALQFLERIIRLDPNSRITVEQALSHSYLKVYHEPEDEPSHPSSFNFDFEKYETIGEMRTAITREIVKFKKSNAEKNKPPAVPLTRLKEIPQGFTAESVPKVSRDNDETLTGAADVDAELEIKEKMDKKD